MDALNLFGALLYAYLFLLSLKHLIEGKGALRSVALTLAVFLIPSVSAIHFMGGFKPFAPGPFNDPANWWVISITKGEGLPPAHLNFIVAVFVASAFYLAATLAVEAASFLYDRKGVTAHAIHKVLIKWAIVVTGFLFYLGTQRVSLTPLVVGMGAASIIVGLALQETLANLFAGLSMEAESALERGQWIELEGQVVGRVLDKGWRSTRIITIKDELVVIPNRLIASGRVINYNQPEPCHALVLKMGASYKDPPVKVKELLRNILLREPDVADAPPPRVYVSEYGDYYVNYTMMFWIRDHGKRLDIADSIFTKVWYAFHNHGVEIPFPVRTVHMMDRAEREEADAAIEETNRSTAEFFHGLNAFSRHLSMGECRYLARNSTETHAAPGDRVIRKGDPGDSVFFIREGNCEVELPGQEMKPLGTGEYFGEMALLSSAPRTADVRASEKGATVLRVGRECMETLFESRPELKREFQKTKDMRVEEAGMAEAESGPEPSRLTIITQAVGRFLKPW